MYVYIKYYSFPGGQFFTIHLSGFIEMETVVAFYYMSTETFQLEPSTVIF